MRRLVRAVLIAAAVLALPAGPQSDAAKQIRVAYVADASAIEDGGIGQSDYEGFVAAVKKLPVYARVLLVAPRQAWDGELEFVARHGYDLVIAGPFLDPVVVKEIALKFPAATFATVDADAAYLGRIPKNMVTYSTGAEQGAYLAGYLAALLEQRRPGKDVIGSVGGYPVQSVRDFIVGYEAGARKAVPGITTLHAYSDNFSTPSRCKPLAAAQIANGAGAVFDVAGICGLGVLAAARERGVWGIGVDTDLAHLGPHILTSVVKVSEPLYALMLRTYLDGTLRGGRNVPLGLREGVIALGKISPRVPRAVLARVERIRAQIAAGAIKVAPAKPQK